MMKSKQILNCLLIIVALNALKIRRNTSPQNLCETDATPKYSCGLKGGKNQVCGPGRQCSEFGWCGSSGAYKNSMKKTFSNNLNDACPKVTPANKTYTDLGAQKDTAVRALRCGPYKWGQTAETCMKKCSNYKQFALQANGWCSCDNDLDHVTIQGKSSCPKVGGAWCNYVYYNPSASGKDQCSKIPKPKNTTTKSPCVKCAVGTFGETVGNVSKCEECPLGTQSDKPGSTKCEECPVGSYTATLGTKKCVKCPAGTYNGATKGNSLASCIKCPIGQINPLKGQSECVLTPDGTCAASEGLLAGTFCSAGEQQDKPGCSTECKKCPVGYYGTNKGAKSKSKCVPCAIGTFVNVEGSDEKTDCTDCPIGTYSSKKGSSKCTSCSPGHFCPLVGADEEIACKLGTQQPNKKSSSCLLCPIGQYGIKIGESSLLTGCAKCAKGNYQNEEGQTSCDPCLKDTQTAEEGMTQCEKCDAKLGYQTEKKGSTKCKKCAAGAVILPTTKAKSTTKVKSK